MSVTANPQNNPMSAALRKSKTALLWALCPVLLLIAFIEFFAQDPATSTPRPTPTTSPVSSPSPSPSPTPAPATPSPSPTPNPAAQNFHQWGSVTLFNGLPSDNVRSIAQTPDGVMWFGTDSGLARFDGRRIETVTLDGDASIKILVLKTGPDGTLWIGTEKGAFRYRGSRFERIENLPGAISFILPGDPNIVAAVDFTLSKVVLNADGSVGPAEKFQDILGRATGITKTNDGLLVATYGEGRSVYGSGSGATMRYDTPLFINAMAQDTAANIWLGADVKGIASGLFSITSGSNAEKLGDDVGSVLSVESDNQGGVWVGTAKNGLYHFHGKAADEHFTLENTAGGLRSNSINAVFLDREGVVWVGTNRGVGRYDGASPFIQTLTDSPNGNFVRTLFRSTDGRIFAGTNRGIFVRDGEKWSEFRGSPAKTFYAITEDPSAKMLIGGPGGIMDAAGRQLAEGDIRAFAKFGGRMYAAAFDRGLLRLDDTDSPVGLGANPTALYADNEKLWAGTANGLLFSSDGRKAKPEPGVEALKGTAIRKIAARSENELWIAGAAGLFLYNKNGTLQSVVPNYDVRDFIANGPDVWAATQNGGLLHIGHDDLFGWIVSDLNVEQGMPSQQVFALLSLDKRLLIGTNRGIVNYLPGNVRPNVIISRVLSRRLHDAEEWTRQIDLEYPQNSLLVEVAGQSSRTFPEQFQYAFILRNSAGDIIDKRLAHDAQFSVSNMKPGTYSVEGRAFNKDLLFSEPVTIRFSVARAPFPWTATALSILLAIAIVALIWAIIERRRIVLRNRELAAARFDLANEAERERRRIARDLHDQTLADLRNLMLMSDKLTPGNTEFRSEIESVSTEIRRICEDLSPSVLENVGLIAALEFLLSHTVDQHKFTAAEDLEERIKFPINVQLQIYRIAQEVLTNIKRHSNAGLVTMNVAISPDSEFTLSIADDGTPFHPSQAVAKGRGIANIHSRAALIGADLDWSHPDQPGTLFELKKLS